MQRIVVVALFAFATAAAAVSWPGATLYAMDAATASFAVGKNVNGSLIVATDGSWQSTPPLGKDAVLNDVSLYSTMLVAVGRNGSNGVWGRFTPFEGTLLISTTSFATDLYVVELDQITLDSAVIGLCSGSTGCVARINSFTGEVIWSASGPASYANHATSAVAWLDSTHLVVSNWQHAQVVAILDASNGNVIRTLYGDSFPEVGFPCTGRFKSNAYGLWIVAHDYGYTSILGIRVDDVNPAPVWSNTGINGVICMAANDSILLLGHSNSDIRPDASFGVIPSNVNYALQYSSDAYMFKSWFDLPLYSGSTLIDAIFTASSLRMLSQSSDGAYVTDILKCYPTCNAGANSWTVEIVCIVLASVIGMLIVWFVLFPKYGVCAKKHKAAAETEKEPGMP